MPLYLPIFSAAQLAHVMKNLPQTQLIFDNISSSIIKLESKYVLEKADTVLTLPKRQGAKPSSARDCMTSEAREKQPNQKSIFIYIHIYNHITQQSLNKVVG
jgi:hypothetical protein